MATGKRKSKKNADWLDGQVDELNEAFENVVVDEKTSKQIWPKVTKGSHLTVIEHQSGKTELIWDDEALLKDVQNAILKFESNISAKSSTGLTEAKKSAKVIKTKPLRTKKSKT